MKKLILLMLAFVSLNSFASGSLFDFNEDALNKEFAELIVLENAVINDASMTFQKAIEQNMLNENFNAAFCANSMQSSFEFMWEGFLWGFLCCPIGLFVVAVNKNKTKDNKTSYWIGVAASSVISMVYYVAVAATTVATTP